ncbi:ComEC/Rec2 family competence protein [Haliscomenobacter sp.]|uniref:ComEC/Rec2 family competence protein n=1 Tax=Haliscomenobacter sp. TaxID=2717303 RepID=UPI0035935A21
MNWRTLPMPRLLLPLVLGIVIGDCWRVSWQEFQQWYYWGFGGIGLLFLALAFRPDFRARAWFGGMVFLVLLCLGFFRIEQNQQWNRAPHFSWQAVGDSCSIWGKVLEARPAANSFRVLLKVKARAAPGTKKWQPATGELLVYLKVDTGQVTPQSGQHLYISGLIDTVKPPLNPDAFDFRAYLARQGVYHQLFAPMGAWRIDSVHQDLPLTLVLQAFCLKVLEKHLPSGDTYAVGAALIIGARSQLSQEIRQAYSNSGAVHVLSVSGLHVGVLAIALRFLLGFFAHNKKAQKLGLLLELGSIWLFTLITGAAPATLRAAVMFSMIIGARAVVRQYNIWNILAASAFSLLCWQPNLLWDIGFQLSYLAIAGIVAFQSWIYERWSAPNVVLDYIWKLTSVGIAAQLSTGPLSIYYFHQFPLFFWLSGLVAVPLAGLVLMLGLSLFLLEALHIPADWIGQLLSWSIQLLNGLIVAIHDLPQAVISGFWWNALATLGMYGVLTLVCVALYHRKLRWLNVALALLLVWALAQWPGIFRAQAQRQLVCYHVPKASLLDLIQGREVLTLSTADTLPELMAAQNHRFHMRLKKEQQLDWQSSFRWGPVALQSGRLLFGKHKIGLIGENEGSPLLPYDYLLVHHNPKIYPADIPKKTKLIILDGSNRFGTRRWIKKLADELNIPVHDTAEQGAWILNL